jgi:isoleucyl-tRNA synthetase
LSFYKLYEQDASNKKQETNNILDKWLLAKLNVLIAEVTKQMEAYDLPHAVRPIADFIDEFSTWWLRRSRDRFKGINEQDKAEALATFKYVLTELSKIMAPFTPFIAEYVYKEVGTASADATASQGQKESVHLEKWPEASEVDVLVIEQMDKVRKIVELGLAARAEAGLKIRQPLASAIIKNYELKITNGQDQLERLIMEELNVKGVKFEKGTEIKVELDTEITEELKVEGALRELVRSINDQRKKAGLSIGDTIKVSWSSAGEIINKVFADLKFVEELKQSTITSGFSQQDNAGQEIEINGEKIKIAIEKI